MEAKFLNLRVAVHSQLTVYQTLFIKAIGDGAGIQSRIDAIGLGMAIGVNHLRSGQAPLRSRVISQGVDKLHHTAISVLLLSNAAISIIGPTGIDNATLIAAGKVSPKLACWQALT